MTNSPKKGELGKLINRLRIKVEGHQYDIEVFNKDTQADDYKIYSVVVNGEVYKVEVEDLGLEPKPELDEVQPVDDKAAAVTPPEVQKALPVTKEPSSHVPGTIVGKGTVVAPMPGKVLSIKVNVGDKVEAGQPVLILEAMKMENVLNAPVEGTVREIKVEPGVNANQGDELIVIE